MSDMRLIDANGLQREYIAERRRTSPMHKYQNRIVVVVRAENVDNAPTIDAVPVVHARWVKDRERNTYCSHCEKYIPAVHWHDEYQDYESEWDEEIDETEYCPNCGAKMDGGAADV